MYKIYKRLVLEPDNEVFFNKKHCQSNWIITRMDHIHNSGLGTSYTKDFVCDDIYVCSQGIQYIQSIQSQIIEWREWSFIVGGESEADQVSVGDVEIMVRGERDLSDVEARPQYWSFPRQPVLQPASPGLSGIRPLHYNTSRITQISGRKIYNPCEIFCME